MEIILGDWASTWKEVKSVRFTQSGTCDHSSFFEWTEDGQVGESTENIHTLFLLLSSSLRQVFVVIQSLLLSRYCQPDVWLKKMLVLLLHVDALMTLKRNVEDS